jgi:hypothetical protein
MVYYLIISDFSFQNKKSQIQRNLLNTSIGREEPSKAAWRESVVISNWNKSVQWELSHKEAQKYTQFEINLTVIYY